MTRITYHLTTLIIVLLAAAGCKTTSEADLKLTWLYGSVSIPGEGTKSGADKVYDMEASGWSEKVQKDVRTNAKIPAVLFMHGCSGLGGFNFVADLFTKQKYAVFAPDSFRRPGRVSGCNTGMLDERIQVRHEEIAYALTQIRALDWVDQDRILLAGFSEGGNATDSWWKSGFRAHIIFGSACTHSGYGGRPAAPDGVPVLAIVGELDDVRPGKSCLVARTIGGSKSVVIPDVYHEIIQYKETQEAVAKFLKTCCTAEVVRRKARRVLNNPPQR